MNRRITVFFSFLIAFTFSSVLGEQLSSYLQSYGYKNIQISEVPTKGATDCKYFIVYDAASKYFIKTGEKVDKEIENILFLSKKGLKSIPVIFAGTSKKDRVLVEEFFPEQDFGYKSVNNLHLGSMTATNFIKIQKKAFLLLNELYQIPINDTSPSFIFDGRIEQRLHDILCDKENIHIITNSKLEKIDLSIRDLLNLPINYSKNEEMVDFPTLVEMVEIFINRIKLIPAIPKRILHGDFHAPNLTKDKEGNLRIVDLSDVMFGEDPAWDLGKWLNHIKRFHRVTATRDSLDDPNVNMNIYDGKIYLVDTYESKCKKIKMINRDAIINFAKMIDMSYDLVALRSSAAEFIVNVSTLKRHMKRFPNSTKTVLVCIVESYRQFLEELKNYEKKHSRH